MLNNSFTKTNTIFGQALGCTALDDAFVKLLSDVNADGVTQFLVRTNGEEKMKTVAQINSESLEAGVRERIFDKVSPKYIFGAPQSLLDFVPDLFCAIYIKHSFEVGINSTV